MVIQAAGKANPGCQYRVRYAHASDSIYNQSGWKSYRHRFWVLDVGGVSVRVDGRLHKRNRYSVGLYAPEKTYEEIGDPGSLVFWRWLLIEEKGKVSELQKITGKEGFRILNDSRQVIHKAIEKYVEVAAQKSPARSYHLQSLLYHILATLWDLHTGESHVSRPTGSLYPHPWRRKAWDILEKSGGRMTSADLATALGVSRATLTHQYRRLCGESLKDSLYAWRMEKARVLLGSSDRSIKEVATLTGFAHQSYFSIFFKTATGYTPVEYRRQCL